MDAGLKNLITKAENGDVDAMVMVGDCFTRGINTQADDVQSHKYYKMAADKGHVKASAQVGIDFMNGIGVRADKKQGVKYITYAADHGEAFAQFLLGMLYENGEIGISKTLGIGKAIMYYEMAAKQGYAKAQLALAYLYNDNGYALDKQIFWFVCAYLHGMYQESMEESEKARDALNQISGRGIFGKKDRINRVIETVKRDYPSYLREPK